MKAVLISLIFSLFFISCENENCNCEINQDVTLSNEDFINNLNINWKTYNQEDLRTQKLNSYRLVMIPNSFSNKESKIYTMINEDDNYYITVEYYNKQSKGIYYDSLNRNEKHTIPYSKWNKFNNYINKNCFWTMSCFEDKNPSTDGYLWQFEAYNNDVNVCTSKNYHIVIHKNSFKFCDELIKLIDIEV